MCVYLNFTSNLHRPQLLWLHTSRSQENLFYTKPSAKNKFSRLLPLQYCNHRLKAEYNAIIVTIKLFTWINT